MSAWRKPLTRCWRRGYGDRPSISGSRKLVTCYRSTKDFDVVLCVEVVDPAFADCSATFLEEGGYNVWATAEGDRKFFRFENPTNKSFAEMVELFSRPPATHTLPPSYKYVRPNIRFNKRRTCHKR
jgi:hypothetical protein